MSQLITIHDKNGTDAVTVTPEHLLAQLHAYGVLNPVRDLVQALSDMAANKAAPESSAYLCAVSAYKQAMPKVRAMIEAQPAPAPAQKNAVRADTTKCSGCGALVVWMTTMKNKSMPADADTVKPGEKIFDPARHRSHFSTCSKASQFRKDAPKKKSFTRPAGVTAEEQAQLFDK